MANRLTTLNAAVDAAITNATSPGSVTATIEGTQIKSAAAYANPMGYGLLRVNLTQTGTADPAVTELENTTGLTFIYVRQSAGLYQITPSSAVVVAKCTILAGLLLNSNDAVVYGGISNTTTISIHTAVAGTGTDGLLNQTTLELRIYP